MVPHTGLCVKAKWAIETKLFALHYNHNYPRASKMNAKLTLLALAEKGW